MCTSVILFRKNSNWPLILATNRDEYFNRKSLPPGKHWKNQPDIIGGLDRLAGGTWCAVNESGLVACIHNRTLGVRSFTNKSRGEIIIKILKGKNINEAKKILEYLDLSDYQGFNLIFGNNKKLYWLKHSDSNPTSQLSINNIPEGISVITNCDLNDIRDKKTKYYIKEFSNTPYPNPDSQNWLYWETLLKNDKIEKQTKPEESICFNINNKFGTVSSAIISLKNEKKTNGSIIYRYTEGPPNINIYKNVKLL